jgi:hypothetical protein
MDVHITLTAGGVGIRSSVVGVEVSGRATRIEVPWSDIPDIRETGDIGPVLVVHLAAGIVSRGKELEHLISSGPPHAIESDKAVVGGDHLSSTAGEHPCLLPRPNTLCERVLPPTICPQVTLPPPVIVTISLPSGVLL